MLECRQSLLHCMFNHEIRWLSYNLWRRTVSYIISLSDDVIAHLFYELYASDTKRINNISPKNYDEEMPERCKKSAKSRKTWQFLRGAFSAIPPRRDNRGENVLQDKARTFQLTVSILQPVQDKKKHRKRNRANSPWREAWYILLLGTSMNDRMLGSNIIARSLASWHLQLCIPSCCTPAALHRNSVCHGRCGGK